MNGKIYKITNIINQKVYIGQTRQKLVHSRWAVHKSLSVTAHEYLYRAMRKYGLENFKFVVILDGIETEEELGFQETKFIDQYNSFNPKFGYNMTTGGENYKLSVEARRKISEANRKRKVKPETRKKQSDFHTGLRASDETKKKQSDFHKNNPNSGQFKKEKLPNETSFKKGHKWSEETRQKALVARIGKKRGPYQKKIQT
jgi:group I intron endonuclease